MNKKLRFSMLSVLMMLCGSMFADETVIWQENWDSSAAGTKVEEVTNANATYTGDNGGYVKLYENSSDKTNLELLIPKSSRNVSFSAEITLNGATSMKLTFDINKNVNLTSTTSGAKLTKVSNTEYDITVPSGTNKLILTFAMGSDSNARLDNIKMVASDGGGGQEDNNFTGQTVENIAAFNALAADTEARLTLTNAVVLYVNEYNNTKEIFVRDASGAALDIYEMGINATAGQVLNGSLVGKRSVRNGFIYAMVKGGTYTDGFNVTMTNGSEPEALDLGIDEVAGYYCDYVVVKNAEITSDKKKAVVDGDELLLYDRFKLSLVNDLKADGTKYEFYGLMYDGGATYGAELVVTKVTLAGGGDIVDDPATPVANVEALLGLESPSTNLELTLTDAQVLIVDNNYIYVRENGKAICFYQVNAVKEVVKKNSILNGKINVDYEVYKLLPEVKTNKNTTADNLTVTDGDDAVPTETTLANVAAGNNVCDLVTLKATLVKEVKTSDGGNTSTTYYLQDGDTKIVVVNNGMGLDKIEEGTEITVVGIANTNNNAHQIKLFKKVEDTTGISNLNVENAGNGQLFNVAGQRVSGSYKGIVIANGKKFVVK